LLSYFGKDKIKFHHFWLSPGKIFLVAIGKINFGYSLEKVLPTPMLVSTVRNTARGMQYRSRISERNFTRGTKSDTGPRRNFYSLFV